MIPALPKVQYPLNHQAVNEKLGHNPKIMLDILAEKQGRVNFTNKKTF